MPGTRLIEEADRSPPPPRAAEDPGWRAWGRRRRLGRWPGLCGGGGEWTRDGQGTARRADGERMGHVRTRKRSGAEGARSWSRFRYSPTRSEKRTDFTKVESRSDTGRLITYRETVELGQLASFLAVVEEGQFAPAKGGRPATMQDWSRAGSFALLTRCFRTAAWWTPDVSCGVGDPR
jgi:hypothetical protein